MAAFPLASHSGWDLISRAAENPLVHAKVSDLYAATGYPGAFRSAQIRPYLDRALEVFGANRLVSSSDWPICFPLGGYNRIYDTLMRSSAVGRPTAAAWCWVARLTGSTESEERIKGP